MIYHGYIYGRIPATVGLIGREGAWTCEHDHRVPGAAFECAVKRAKQTVLKSSRDKATSAGALAGIRDLIISVKEVVTHA